MSSEDDDLFSYDSNTSAGDFDSNTTSDSSLNEKTFRDKIGASSRRYGSGTNVPMIANIVNYTFTTASKIGRTDTLDTPMRAVYDFVNQSTEGFVDLVLTKTELESKIVLLNSQKNFINVIHQVLEDFGRESSVSNARFAMYIDCFVDYVDFSLSNLTKQYVDFCATHGLKHDKSIVERGVYAYITPSLAFIGGNPPGDLHYKYGDISTLRSRYHAMMSIWITYGLQLVREKENSSFSEVFV